MKAPSAWTNRCRSHKRAPHALAVHRECAQGAPSFHPAPRGCCGSGVGRQSAYSSSITWSENRQTIRLAIYNVGYREKSLTIQDLNLQIQRVKRDLLQRETKTQSSTAPLPLPALCLAALKLRQEDQREQKRAAGREWIETGLAFTTDRGTAVDPRLQPAP